MEIQHPSYTAKGLDSLSGDEITISSVEKRSVVEHSGTIVMQLKWY